MIQVYACSCFEGIKQRNAVNALFFPSHPATKNNSLFCLFTPKVISHAKKWGCFSAAFISSSWAQANATSTLLDSWRDSESLQFLIELDEMLLNC